MAALRTSSHRVFVTLSRWGILITLITMLLAGCQGLSPQNSPASTSVSPVTQVKTPQTTLAEITFDAQTPAKMAEGQYLFIEFMDEVTGLALNPARVRMASQDGQNFEAKVPFAIGTVLKYRYLRDKDPIGVEYSTLGTQVRYRLYAVEGPGVVHDTIAAWKSLPASGELGRIQGQVSNKSNHAPVVNAMVAAGGLQTLTSSDGSFLLEGLPAGTHNLVVYSLDGSFRAFQQGAVVAPQSTTPAPIALDPAKTVNVTFQVRPPADNMKGIPIRLVGNTFSLGNTFSDLRGGTSVSASRAPLMMVQQDGQYTLTLKLPVGFDLRYKYTLGDGFWNAELDANHMIRVRQLIVPAQNITVADSIDTWKTNNFAPISFTVSVPDNTPVSDTVSIQFNPFSWTEPMPMWPVGKNRWFYILYNPLNAFNSASYRFCRNDQCGSADAADTQGDKAQGKTFSPKESEQSFADTVKAWAWFDASSEPVVVSAGQVTARDANFQAGVAFSTGYHPSWQPYIGWAMQNIKEIGSNTVMLTPTWSLTHQAPPVIAPVPGHDPLWFDVGQMAVQAQQKGLGVVIHPVLQYGGDPQQWWQTASRDDGWWQSWFDRYRTFLLYHADLATQTGAKALIIGDETIYPALPGGTLADGSPSGVPGDASERWDNLLNEVRSRYKGRLAWMISYAGKLPPTPDFIKDGVDLLYVEFSAPLIKADEPAQADLEASIASMLDTDILKLQEQTNHPVLFGLKFPSVRGAFDGCVEAGGNCLPMDTFERPVPNAETTELSLKDQALAYSAALTVINQRSWIAGFFAAGYYPPVELKDLSTSTHSKPAGDVLWYWYPRMLGQTGH